jgi:hypothetical protein
MLVFEESSRMDKMLDGVRHTFKALAPSSVAFARRVRAASPEWIGRASRNWFASSSKITACRKAALWPSGSSGDFSDGRQCDACVSESA